MRWLCRQKPRPIQRPAHEAQELWRAEQNGPSDAECYIGKLGCGRCSRCRRVVAEWSTFVQRARHDYQRLRARRHSRAPRSMNAELIVPLAVNRRRDRSVRVRYCPQPRLVQLSLTVRASPEQVARAWPNRATLSEIALVDHDCRRSAHHRLSKIRESPQMAGAPSDQIAAGRTTSASSDARQRVSKPFTKGFLYSASYGVGCLLQAYPSDYRHSDRLKRMRTSSPRVRSIASSTEVSGTDPRLTCPLTASLSQRRASRWPSRPVSLLSSPIGQINADSQG